MEDLWRIENSAIEIEEYAELSDYKKFLARFCNEEVQDNRRGLLFKFTPAR